MNTRQMLEKRAQLVKEMRDMQDTADTSSDGTLTDGSVRKPSTRSRPHSPIWKLRCSAGLYDRGTRAA